MRKRILAWLLCLSLVGFVSSVSVNNWVHAGSYSSSSGRSSSSSSGGYSGSSGSRSSPSSSGYSSGSKSTPAPSKSDYGSGLTKAANTDDSRSSYQSSKSQSSSPKVADVTPSSTDSTDSSSKTSNKDVGDADDQQHRSRPQSGNSGSNSFWIFPSSGSSSSNQTNTNQSSTVHSTSSAACATVGFLIVAALLVAVCLYFRPGPSVSMDNSGAGVGSNRRHNESKLECANSPGVKANEEYNPLNLKIHSRVRVDNIDYRHLYLTVLKIEEITSCFSDGSIFKLVDYHLMVSEPGKDGVDLTSTKLRIIPKENADIVSGDLFQAVMFVSFDMLRYDEAKELIENVLEGDAEDFTIDATGETFWRHAGRKEPYKSNNCIWWLYSRGIIDAGVTIPEFVLIEQDTSSGMVSLSRGRQISGDLISDV